MTHTLYYTLGSGNSFMPALVLHQTGRTCAMHHIDVLAGQSRHAEFVAINSRGQVPYLVTDDGRGIGESNAIAWFLAEGTQLMPSDPVARAQAIQWMIYEQTALEPNISPARFFTHIVPGKRAEYAADIVRWQAAGASALQVLDAYLRTRSFITDHGYSVADIAVYGYTHLAREGGFDLDRFPHVLAWMKRVSSTRNYASTSQLLRVEAAEALSV